MRLEVSQPREGTTVVEDEFRTASYTITPVKNADNMAVVMKAGQVGEEVIAKFDFRTLRLWGSFHLRQYFMDHFLVDLHLICSTSASSTCI